MKEKITVSCKHLSTILFFLIVFGCATNKELTSLSVSNDEALVSGKLRVLYNENDVTTETKILFNEIMWGKYLTQTDEEGHFIIKLPLGEAFIARIAYNNFFLNIPKEKTIVTIEENTKINYIGNITINWAGPDSKMPNMFGLVGALADEMIPDGGAKFYVDDNEVEVVNHINNKYGANMSSTKLLIPAPTLAFIDKYTSVNEENPIKKNPLYLTVNINDGRVVEGLLIGKKKKKEVYVEDENILYVINTEMITSIIENGEDVTDTKLNEQFKKRINFNQYMELIDIR